MNKLNPISEFFRHPSTKRATALLAAAAMGSAGCGPSPARNPYQHFGPRGCSPYEVATGIDPVAFKDDAVVVTGKSEAYGGQAGGSAYRVIVKFPDNPD